MKSKWKIGLTAAFAAAVASLVVAPIASAHTPTLTANLDCNGTVTWTLSSDGFDATFTITDAIQGPEGSGALTTANGDSTSGTYTIPTSITTDTVTANITWADGFTGNTSPSAQITRPSNCTPPPPPQVCTYTKGFYRNHPGVTADLIAGMGGSIPVGNGALSAKQAQAVLNATPGQPGNVTFTTNLLLNLAQQVITAELNIARGSAAGADVQTAITAANASVNVSLVGGTIGLSSSLSAGDASALESTVDTFNESDDCR